MRREMCRFTGKVIVPVAVTLITLVLLAGCVPLPGEEPVPGVVGRLDLPSSADGFHIPCTVYLPNGYDANRTYPLWVELHSLGGQPIIDNNPFNPFSSEFKRLADEKGWILIAPWGRNLHSLFVDGMVKDRLPYYEPDTYDDFSQGAASWQTLGGTWQVVGGAYRQSDSSSAAKESIRLDSEGTDYGVRLRVKDLTPPGTESILGVTLRRKTASGDGYRVELIRDTENNRSVRYVMMSGGVAQEIVTKQCDWSPTAGRDYTDFKVSCYEGYLLTTVNDTFVNMQDYQYDEVAYGCGRNMPGEALSAGEVGLYSKGGIHEFDEVRVQNEYMYGERDVLDSILSIMERYRIDPGKVYVTGHSMGGLGTFVLGLHNPDLCAALRPAGGFTDIYHEYNWLETYYPDNPDIPPYANVNDGRLKEFMRMLAGGEPDPAYPERMSVLNGNSARYILENGVNNYWRIVHGTPDFNVPNSYDPVTIYWWVPQWGSWTLGEAPAPYSPATSTYANGKDIADLLQSWSSPGRYYCDYITDPYIGHGFLEPYASTADFFQGKALSRSPAEVAYKTYDGVNTGAWWLRLEIPNPGRNEPGMARVAVDAPANSAAIHARNLSSLSLDLGWMGLDIGAGKTISFTLDDDTSPNVFPINDTTGALTLELMGAWTAASGYEVELDGTALSPDTGYTVDGTSMVLPGVPVAGAHTLTVTVPPSLPANMAPNPGAETDAGGGVPAAWTGEILGGGSASFLWDDLQRHGGDRALRVKDAGFSSAGARAAWTSDRFAVTAEKQYLLGVFSKARMLRDAAPGVGITWYDASNNPISTSWVVSPGTEEHALNMEWRPLRLAATAPPGTAYASILLGVEGENAGNSAGSAWFDDVSFTSR